MRKILLAATSIDGYIAHHAKQFTDWTSKEDKDHLHAHLDAADIILVGNNTYQTAIAPLSKRVCIVFSRKEPTLSRINAHSVFLNPAQSNLEEYLETHGFSNVAILGGTETYNYCLCYNLVSEIFLTIEPIVFGKGLRLFETDEFLQKKFCLESSQTINNKGSILLHYKIYE